MEREKFKWQCQVQRQDGEVFDNIAFESYWSPEKDNITPESIANAAAAQMCTQDVKYRGISAVLRS